MILQAFNSDLNDGKCYLLLTIIPGYLHKYPQLNLYFVLLTTEKQTCVDENLLSDQMSCISIQSKKIATECWLTVMCTEKLSFLFKDYPLWKRFLKTFIFSGGNCQLSVNGSSQQREKMCFQMNLNLRTLPQAVYVSK